MTIEDLKKLKPVETEQEYWIAHKILKKEINKMTIQVKRFMGNPKTYLKEFEDLLDEGIRLNIITKEFKVKQMERIFNELNKPSEFKEWLSEKLQKAKSKLKKN